jgi:hypothetical protein
MKSDLVRLITVMLIALCGLDAAHAQTIGDSFQMAGWGWFIGPAVTKLPLWQAVVRISACLPARTAKCGLNKATGPAWST